MKFTVDEELKIEGCQVRAAIFETGKIVNKVAELEDEKSSVFKRILDSNAENPISHEYKRLHDKYGQPGILGPAEFLVNLAKKNRRLPNINCVVDAYNLISALTFLSIGAHDLNNVKGNLKLTVCNGNEIYTPLGSGEKQKVNAGEYACTDDEKVICWLDIKQCNETKITKDTKKYIIYIQGNSKTSKELLEEALNLVVNYQTRFCAAKLLELI